jgi:predicted methyltransferase
MRFISLMTAGVISLMMSAQVLADDALRAAVDNPNRPAEQAERDSSRNPYETLTFFGISPDMTVVEISPSGGWYTEILAPYLKDEGQLVAAHWDLEGDNVPDFYRRIRAGFEERFGDTDQFGTIEIIPFAPPEKVDLGTPDSADMVLTFRNVHSYKRAGTFGDVIDAAHAVLKPGGVFGVVSHRLPEDREQDPDARSGYVKQSWVVEMAEARGFKLDASSEVNANPRDTADHPSGVWSLPPSLREGDESAERFEAIGESDRFTLRFVKD